MKVHCIDKNCPLIKVALQVVKFDEQSQEMTDLPNEADVIMTNNSSLFRKLYEKYGDTKFLVLFDTNRDEINMPEANVFGAGSRQFLEGSIEVVVGMVKKYQKWAKNRSSKPKTEIRRIPLGDVVMMSKSYKVLIVDDKQENLQIAVERLVGQQIIPVDSPATALSLLQLDDRHGKSSIDAVLTDLNMIPDKMYPSLNLDRYGLNEEVPAGISVMFEATKRGIPVAIVTDANHHLDWFSAMFDHWHEATVNGQRVVFHHSGKQWDVALKKLMEPAES